MPYIEFPEIPGILEFSKAAILDLIYFIASIVTFIGLRNKYQLFSQNPTYDTLWSLFFKTKNNDAL